MKKYILFTLALTFMVSGYSQDWKNSNFIRGTADITVINSNVDLNNNTILYGYFTGTLQPRGLPEIVSRGARDYFLAKIDPNSNILWVKGIGGNSLEFIAGGCAIDSDNSIFITGSFQNDLYYTDVDFISSTGSHDIFLAKYDTNGDNMWCINAGSGNSYQRATALNIDKQHNILLGGYYQDSININGDTTLYANAFKDYFYGKFNSTTGSLIWAKGIESINSAYSGFIYSFATADDHYVLSGVFSDSVRLAGDTIVSQTVNYYDTHVLKTDTAGNIQWYRKIQGNLHDYSYNSVLDPDDNIYITGYYNSTSLTFDSTETETVVINQYKGSYDFFVAKYSTDGTLQWIRVNGGIGEDRLLRANFFDGNLWVTGYFVDQINWGAQTLTTAGGAADTDMFYGSIDADGNYTGATKYAGRNNSTEWGRSVFNDSETLYAVLRTNSDLFSAGDSIYLNPSGVFYIIVGSVGCLPISVSATPVHVTGCFEDSTGIISVTATGGFGATWKYTIGGDFPYQESPLFTNLPAGDYLPQALDRKNCYGAGNPLTLTQPTEITVTSIDSTDVLCMGESTGTITLNASGGTGNKTFSIDSAATFVYSNGASAMVPIGSYDIFVKDNNDCVVAAGTATILEPEGLSIVLDSIKDALCYGVGNGFIEMSAAGGTMPYQYSIDGSSFQSDSVFDDVMAGSYTIEVKDQNDCSLSGDELTINEPEELSISLTSSADITDDNDGSIIVSAAGGTAPYTFTISPDAGSQDPDGTFTFISGQQNDYTVMLSDANLCGPVSLAPVTISDLTDILSLQEFKGAVYPNPSNGQITIEFETNNSEVTLELISVDGRVLMNKTLYSNGGKIREQLDISSFDKGIYLLRMDQKVVSRALIVQ